MVCCSCGEKITKDDPEYCYRETEDAYIPQHRKCSESDPHWKRLDEQQAEQDEHQARYRQACREFVELWGMPSIEDFQLT